MARSFNMLRSLVATLFGSSGDGVGRSRKDHRTFRCMGPTSNLRGQVLQRGVGERCSTEPRDKIPLVSLLLLCTYFKHYFHLPLNAKCLLVKSYRVVIFIH